MAANEAWQRLGEMLLNRRVELAGDTNFAAFARKAGVNAKGEARHGRTFFNIETAKQDHYLDATKALVEQVYRWAPGSIKVVLAGGQPNKLSDGQRPAVVPAVPLGLNDRIYTGDAELVREHVVQWYLSAPVEKRDHAIALLIQFTREHPNGGDEGD